MATELWLFTMNFPYGNGEAFLENELPYLAAEFERVRLFPMHPKGSIRALPPNVHCTPLFAVQEVYRSMPPLPLLANWTRFRHVLRMARRSAPSRAVYREHRREFISELRQAMQREHLLQQRLAPEFDPARVRLYSYWTSEWATVLGLWRLRDKRVRFVSRMMGFDMYDHRAPGRWQRFQDFHVQQADHIFVIAKAGLEHMHTRFHQYRSKFSLSYLATKDNGMGPWAPDAALRIVSCANLVELKRVHLIAEALRHVTGPVRWTHFGEGPERARVEAVINTLPPNVSVELMGSRPNREVIAWYKANPVDVFVHASRTEGGVPVALQEAASFGIPLVAAEAGGVREVVTDATGVLLPNALSPVTLADTLNGFRDSRWNGPDARKEIRAYWAGHFNAEQVFGNLLEQLKRSWPCMRPDPSASRKQRADR